MNCRCSAIGMRASRDVALGRTLGLCTRGPPRSRFARKLPFSAGDDWVPVPTAPANNMMGIHAPLSSSSSSVWADAGAPIRPTASNAAINRAALLRMNFGSIGISLSSRRCSTVSAPWTRPAPEKFATNANWDGSAQSVRSRHTRRCVSRCAWNCLAQRIDCFPEPAASGAKPTCRRTNGGSIRRE